MNKENGNKKGMAGSFGNIGAAYEKLSDYNKALEYHLKSIENHYSLISF